jgi:hypothetical protein
VTFRGHFHVSMLLFSKLNQKNYTTI